MAPAFTTPEDELVWALEQTANKLRQLSEYLANRNWGTSADRCRRDARHLDRVACQIMAESVSA